MTTVSFDETKKQFMIDLKKKLKQNKTKLVEWIEYRQHHYEFSQSQEKDIEEFLTKYQREKEMITNAFLSFRT